MGKSKWIVKSAKANADYTIELEFADGTRGVYDARPLLDEPFYAQLNSWAFFATAHVECGTVVWNDEVDIAPERLYEACAAVPVAV